jgi:hypothetical protein
LEQPLRTLAWLVDDLDDTADAPISTAISVVDLFSFSHPLA